jgi:integrase
MRVARGSMRWKGESLELSIPVPGERTPGGNQKYHYEYVPIAPGMTKTDAERAGQARLAELRIELYKGTFVAASKSATVKDLLDWWLNTHQKKRLEAGEIRESTFDWDKWLIESHLNPIIGDRPAGKLTGFDVEEAFTSMRQKKTSETTINGAYRVLRAAYNRAVKARKVMANPCLQADTPKPAYKEHPVLTIDEARKLLAHAGDLYPVILTALLTGMRRGEICGLQWADIDQEKKTISINRSISRIGLTAKGKATITGPKTQNSVRTIPLPDILAEELDKLPRVNEYVFPGPMGPMSPCNLTKVDFARVRDAAGLPSSLRFHDLRHAASTLLHEAGADTKTIADILGHGDSAAVTERIYTHESLAAQGKVINLLGRSLQKTPKNTPKTP